jgi:hypothetical protein
MKKTVYSRIVIMAFIMLATSAFLFAQEVSITWNWSASQDGISAFRYQMDAEEENAWTVVDVSVTEYETGPVDATVPHVLYVQQSFDGENWSASGSIAYDPEEYSALLTDKPDTDADVIAGVDKAEEATLEPVAEPVAVVSERKGPTADMVVKADDSYDEFDLFIVHTNDVMGRIDGTEGIGYAKLATLLDWGRELTDKHLLLDAGNVTSGTPLADAFQGESAAVLLDALGYDAVAPGPADFVYGSARLLDAAGIAEERSDLKVLSANVLNERGEWVFQPYQLYYYNDFVVAVAGVTAPPADTEGLSFLSQDVIDSAQYAVDYIREQADYVILLGSIGNVDGITSEVIAQNVKGIDLIIDGKGAMAPAGGKKVGDTLIVNAGEYLSSVGLVQLQVKNGVVVATYADRITAAEVNDPSISPLAKAYGVTSVPADSETQAVIDYYTAELARITPVVVATEEVAEEPVVVATEEVAEEPVVVATEEVAEKPVVAQPAPVVSVPSLPEVLPMLNAQRKGVELSVGLGGRASNLGIVQSVFGATFFDSANTYANLNTKILPAFAVDFVIDNLKPIGETMGIGLRAGAGYEAYAIGTTSISVINVHALAKFDWALSQKFAMEIGAGLAVVMPIADLTVASPYTFSSSNPNIFYGLSGQLNFRYNFTDAVSLGLQIDARFLFSDAFKPYELTGLARIGVGYRF